jgi:rubredoxin
MYRNFDQPLEVHTESGGSSFYELSFVWTCKECKIGQPCTSRAEWESPKCR